MAEKASKKTTKKAASSSTKKATARKTPAKAPRARKTAAAADPSQAQIAERAYLIYEREGGDAVDNWLRAEDELRSGE